MRKSLLETALLGAVIVLVCDIIGRVIIFPYEISVSVIIGVVGSIVFVYLLTRRRSYA